MKIINIDLNDLAIPRYHYSEGKKKHLYNFQRFEKAEDLIEFLKNLKPNRKYEIHLNIPEKESKLEQNIRNYFPKSIFIQE